MEKMGPDSVLAEESYPWNTWTMNNNDEERYLSSGGRFKLMTRNGHAS